MVFISYFPPSYLFSCWKTMWGKASIHCVGERQSLTSLLAVQQCTLQQPVMCRLLPHICIIIFSFFFAPESTWHIKMVTRCLNSAQFRFLKMHALLLIHPNMGPILFMNDFFLSFSLSLNQTNRNGTQDRPTTLPWWWAHWPVLKNAS